MFLSVDGGYAKRCQEGRVVPAQRWISSLPLGPSNSALRPNNHAYKYDSEMEVYIQGIAGHSRQDKKCRQEDHGRREKKGYSHGRSTLGLLSPSPNPDFDDQLLT